MKPSLTTLALLLLFSISALAADSDRQHIVMKRPAALSSVPFSEAVLVGNTLYLAGQIGLDPKTEKPPAAAEEEAKQVMDEIKQVVEKAGFTMDDLVSVQVFCTDLSLYQTFNTVYRTYFHDQYPARSFIGAGNLLRGARFEVLGIAVRNTK